jgi:hypothetical protein
MLKGDGRGGDRKGRSQVRHSKAAQRPRNLGDREVGARFLAEPAEAQSKGSE